jgi:DNA repair exonuclease SbcCD nuclease subunit
MRLLLVGDLHITNKSITIIHQLARQLNEYLIVNKPDALILMGDTLDNHGNINMSCHKLAVDLIRLWSQQCIVYVIIGNHDRPDNRNFLDDMHPFSGIDSDRIIIVARVKVTTIRDIKIVLVPFVREGRFLEALMTAAEDDALWPSPDHVGKLEYLQADLVMAHQSFQGGLLDSGIEGQHKDIWPINAPTLYSGHLHLRHKVRDNLNYVGTPYTIRYGEQGLKGLTLLDTMTSNILYKPLIKEYLLPLKLPAKRIYNLTVPEANVFVLPDKDLIQARIAVKGTHDELKNFALRYPYTDWKAHGIEVIFYYQFNQMPDQSDTTDVNELYDIEPIHILEQRLADKPDLLSLWQSLR